MPSPDPHGAAERLSALLGLDVLGQTVQGAHVANGGQSNSPAELYLSDGTCARFRRLRTVGNPRSVATELACATGAAPKLTKDEALECIVLVRTVALATNPATRVIE